ncbi:MAG: site-specific DNA-methyltransferase [Bacteroidaceae bacterium]|nr:site-specific DNA-methyltransferase [Bacteroidaceae bacterium]
MGNHNSQLSFHLHHGDCTTIMPQLKQQFDMVFADPPYFLSKGFTITTRSGYVRTFDKGEWDTMTSQQEIYNFNMRWLKPCRDTLKDNGTIWISGTYHNIFQVARCLDELDFKILNIIVWQKSDPPVTFTKQRFNFSAEYLIWARKCKEKGHFFNYDLLKSLNGGRHMPDVWRLPSVGLWEKRCGKHPTQKPLHLLYRIILACTREGDHILDPFAGSCTTGIAANLLGRNFTGIDQSEEYLQLGQRRRNEIDDPKTAAKMLRKMKENPEETTVLVNHARKDLRLLMIEKGICYLRAGDSQGSLQVTPGFERMNYIVLHTGGNNASMFRLKAKGCFQIWTRETLEQHGFSPEHAPYYIVLLFDNSKEIPFAKDIDLRQRLNTYRAKIRPLSDFIGLR